MTTRRALVIALLALPLAACASVYSGEPTIVLQSSPAYWVWHDGVRWHMQITPGTHAHRFHGFITTDGAGGAGSPLANTPVTLRTTDDAWRDGSSQTEHGVAFNVTTDHPGGLSWVGTYGQFDLAIDGIYRPRRVHLGSTGQRAVHVPFTVESP